MSHIGADNFFLIFFFPQIFYVEICFILYIIHIFIFDFTLIEDVNKTIIIY